MHHEDEKKPWENYRERELGLVTPILLDLGFLLEENQPHIGGERHLMQAVTTISGRKLILLGTRIADKKRVVIKITRDLSGARELIHERTCREALQEIAFAYQIFFSPEEIFFGKYNEYTISVQAFIEQVSPFLKRPTEEQFSLALRAFQAQEGAHATVYRHRRFIEKTFGSMDASSYLKSYDEFCKNTIARLPNEKDIHDLLGQGERALKKDEEIIERYGDFLTHTDFVPHNFRVVGEKIYLLDHSSLRFGNKYEGWARFLNFMTLYNRPLEEALLFYIQKNRIAEEYRSLELMRIYKLGEIIWFYTNLLKKTSGNLHTLTTERIKFWSAVLKAILGETLVLQEVVQKYKETRDALRSDEEKERQIDLH